MRGESGVGGVGWKGGRGSVGGGGGVVWICFVSLWRLFLSALHCVSIFIKTKQKRIFIFTPM